MKNLIFLFILSLTGSAFAVCSSPIARTNFATRELLSSSRLNTELNTIYSRSNELPGDCLTDGTVSSSKIIDGTIVNADVSNSASIKMSKTNFGVAILTDEKASAVDSGTFTAGAWRTRTLNKEVDPDGIVSLATNQFTLTDGTYLVEGSAPALANNHKAKVYSITDGADAIIGTSENATTTGSYTRSSFTGILTVTGTKAYEVRHYGQSTVSSVGFGTPVGFPSTVEVYTVVKITRIK